MARTRMLIAASLLLAGAGAAFSQGSSPAPESLQGLSPEKVRRPTASWTTAEKADTCLTTFRLHP